MMTLKDLIDANGSISDLQLTIRDYRNGHGKKIEEIHIGVSAMEDRFLDSRNKPRWKCIREKINHKDMGKDYWGSVHTNIPKKLLDMEVRFFKMRISFKTNNGLNEHWMLYADLVGEKDEEIIKEKPAKETDNQISLFDYE